MSFFPLILCLVALEFSFCVKEMHQSLHTLTRLSSSPGRNSRAYPFGLLVLSSSCYTFVFFCSATFFWKWNQDKLGNRCKCCNSTSNRYRCAVCSSYRRSICPFIPVSGWLSLHKETETTGRELSIFLEKVSWELKVIVKKQLSSLQPACLLAPTSLEHSLTLRFSVDIKVLPLKGICQVLLRSSLQGRDGTVLSNAAIFCYLFVAQKVLDTISK